MDRQPVRPGLTGRGRAPFTVGRPPNDGAGTVRARVIRLARCRPPAQPSGQKSCWYAPLRVRRTSSPGCIARPQRAHVCPPACSSLLSRTASGLNICSPASSMSPAVLIPGSGRSTPSAGRSVRGSCSSRIVGQLPVAGTFGGLTFLVRAVAAEATLRSRMPRRRVQYPHPPRGLGPGGGPGAPGAFRSEATPASRGGPGVLPFAAVRLCR